MDLRLAILNVLTEEHCGKRGRDRVKELLRNKKFRMACAHVDGVILGRVGKGSLDEITAERHRQLLKFKVVKTVRAA